ncbi:MAG: hypothetical protein LBD30_01245 [Verrucomicrobiales bacterium]|nr:hypothetical protein [Verrucomicrobiales bacterium]
MKMLLRGFLLAVSFGLIGAVSAMDLAPFAGARPAPQEDVTVSGSLVGVWRATEKDKNLVCKGSREFRAGLDGAVFLEVTYLDKGYGRLGVQFKGGDNKLSRPDKYTNITLTDSGKWVTAFLRLNAPVVREVQLGMERNKDNTLTVSKITLHDTPFKDGHFEYLLKEDWRRPYDGPSAVKFDNQTMRGKIMVGYQGWFRTPNDPYDRGWFHWGNIPKGEFTVDMWPEIKDYPPSALEKACDVKLLSGKPAYLFSSAWPEVARTHFKWMRENNIDGAFVQRFLTDGMYSENKKHPEWIMGNVRAAANREGRIWAVEYDVSGYRDDKLLEGITRDWKWFVDEFGLKKDPSYAREGGRLVVFIWGMPFDNRKISVETANAVVDWFKNDPQYGSNYVIGGIPGNWRNMSDEWKEHFKRFDALLCWMSQKYAEDLADFKAWGVDYWPHVKPGFSWANLKHIPTGSQQAFTPRRGGAALEEQIDKAVAAGGDRFFVGMFDEYDESTAIMPMSDDAPPTPRRPGVVAKFFPNPNFRDESPNLSLRSQVDLEFGGEPFKNIPAENFSVRWEGTLIPPHDGKYQLSLEGVAGDKAALWIDDKRVVEIKALAAGGNKLAQLDLKQDQPVIFRLDYAHLTGGGRLRLLWDIGFGLEPLPETVYVDAWGRFLTNEGQPSNWWMKLSGDAKEKMKNNPTIEKH